MVLKRVCICAVLVLAGIALGASVASADSSSEAVRREAGEHVKRGVALYKLGRFLEAIDEFEQAYLLFPSDALLYNLGQAHRQLNHCDEALKDYRAFLQGSPESALAPKVRELLPALEDACQVRNARPIEVDSGGSQPQPQPQPQPQLEPQPRGEPFAGVASAPEAPDALIRVRGGLGAGVLASGGAAAAPIGAVVTATRAVMDQRAELGGRLAVGVFAGDPGTSASAIELLAFGGRAIRRGATTLHLDGGLGVIVLSGLPHGLAAGGRTVRGSFVVPEVAALGGIERELGGAWTIGVGAELAVGPSSALRGGAAVAAQLEIGIGYRR